MASASGGDHIVRLLVAGAGAGRDHTDALGAAAAGGGWGDNGDALFFSAAGGNVGGVCEAAMPLPSRADCALIDNC